jgi:hypothetical protein
VLYEGWHRLGRPRLDGRRRSELRGVELVHAPYLAVPPRSRVPLVVSILDAVPVLYPQTMTRWSRIYHLRAIRAARERAET